MATHDCKDTATASTETKINESSVESPYTSLGSGGTSYNSMLLASTRNNISTRTRSSLTNSNYHSLRAKAEEGHVKYETRTKAVMDALQGLQAKIRKIESDRTNAEMNLKCLALETRDYKKLLKKKHSLGGNPTVSNESQSKELENQLEHAQSRCAVLEQQLEGMRKMMRIDPVAKATTTTTTAPETTRTTRSRKHLNKQSSSQNPGSETLSVDTSAIEKLNDLEKEHERFSITQSQTEDKINKLEEKIRKEEHHRKQLQDKTRELQNVFGTKKKLESSTPSPQLVKKKKRKKTSKSVCGESKVAVVSSHTSDKPPSTTTSVSPSHYLVDFSNIPFVVGQSTSKSHSLGANIQSVLSIMKSHNMLCCDDSPKSCARSHSKCTPKQNQLLGSCVHLQELLKTLQDEFALLGFEHRELVLQRKSSSDRESSAKLDTEREKLTERMEAKGKQIRIIQEHLEKVQLAEKHHTATAATAAAKQRRKKENKVTLRNPSDTVEIVTTVRRSPEMKTNPNLDMLKKVKKLQSTLCKDDLKWV